MKEDGHQANASPTQARVSTAQRYDQHQERRITTARSVARLSVIRALQNAESLVGDKRGPLLAQLRSHCFCWLQEQQSTQVASGLKRQPWSPLQPPTRRTPPSVVYAPGHQHCCTGEECRPAQLANERLELRLH